MQQTTLARLADLPRGLVLAAGACVLAALLAGGRWAVLGLVGRTK